MDRLRYRESFALINEAGEPVIEDGRIEWADWDHQGRFVLLREGELLIGEESNDSFVLREFAYFGSQTPEPIATPSWAMQ